MNYELPRYKCHKEVRALKIKEITQVTTLPEHIHRLWFEDNRYKPVHVEYRWILKHNVLPGGYVVWYDDGYISFSPAAAFESGYTLIPGSDSPLVGPLIAIGSIDQFGYVVETSGDVTVKK